MNKLSATYYLIALFHGGNCYNSFPNHGEKLGLKYLYYFGGYGSEVNLSFLGWIGGRWMWTVEHIRPCKQLPKEYLLKTYRGNRACFHMSPITLEEDRLGKHLCGTLPCWTPYFQTSYFLSTDLIDFHWVQDFHSITTIQNAQKKNNININK